MKRFITLAVAGAMLAAGSAFGAVINPYTDSTQFANATATMTLTTAEAFNTASSSIFNISFAGGGTGRAIDPNAVGGGKLFDQVSIFNGANQTTQISLVSNAPLYGISGLWDLSVLSAGGGVKFTINLVGGGTQVLTPILGSAPNGNTGNSTGQFFFGFVSDSQIESITLAANTTFGPENYSLDNLQAITVNPNAVPEPATFGMMGLALVGIGLARRVRR